MQSQKCYLTEEDPPEDHDFQRYSAVCGRCYGALADLERDARNALASAETELTALREQLATAERERDAAQAAFGRLVQIYESEVEMEGVSRPHWAREVASKASEKWQTLTAERDSLREENTRLQAELAAASAKGGCVDTAGEWRCDD